MGDFFLGRACDHLILDEVLTINGLSPNYFGTLNYTANGATGSMIVREFKSTEGMTNFIYALNGFTNWNLLSDRKTVRFNTLGLGPGTSSFLDGSTLIQPPPIILVSYTALDTTCPKHVSGPNLMNDIAFDTGGRIKETSGIDKVRQQVTKAILTNLGSNRLHSEYGSSADDLIGTKFDILAQLQLQQTIQNTVQTLIEAQQLKPDLPLDETLTRLVDLQVGQDGKDPRAVNITMTIQVASYETATVSLPLLTE